MSRRPEAVLVDSGFFFALFDPRDPWHTQAKSKAEWIEAFRVIVPWPILYETVNTRLARRPDPVARFERILRRPDTELLDDSPYRLDAYENTLARAKAQREPASLVDSVRATCKTLGVAARLSPPILGVNTPIVLDFDSVFWS